MAFNPQQGGEGVDPELARFINLETQRQKFSQLVYSLTDTCWDKCVADLRLGTRLESKTESCLVNCVERFIDTTNFIVNRKPQLKEIINQYSASPKAVHAFEMAAKLKIHDSR